MWRQHRPRLGLSAKPTPAALRDATVALQRILSTHGKAGYSALRRVIEQHKNQSRLQMEIAQREQELNALKQKGAKSVARKAGAA